MLMYRLLTTWRFSILIVGMSFGCLVQILSLRVVFVDVFMRNIKRYVNTGSGIYRLAQLKVPLRCAKHIIYDEKNGEITTWLG